MYMCAKKTLAIKWVNGYKRALQRLLLDHIQVVDFSYTAAQLYKIFGMIINNL